jgi:signal transduction histidine kinase
MPTSLVRPHSVTPEVRERLFTQGFTTRPGGHGLGLHSSALAARMLGGRLILESEVSGLGATATLELPLSEESSRSSSATQDGLGPVTSD